MREQAYPVGRGGKCPQNIKQLVRRIALRCGGKRNVIGFQRRAVAVGKQPAARGCHRELTLAQPDNKHAFALAGAQQVGGAYHDFIAPGGDGPYFRRVKGEP